MTYENVSGEVGPEDRGGERVRNRLKTRDEERRWASASVTV